VLRPWGAADAAALVAAWADPDIARWTAVPEDRSPAAAARWIAGWDERRRRGLALDLVVTTTEDTATVLGEVGVSFLTAPPTIGWWVLPAARGRGVATQAVRLLVDQVRASTAVPGLVAEVGDGNEASVAVARAAGFVESSPGRMVLRYDRR
jgi:RimJ/RimL family protein N-acetyltransferase